MRYFIHCLLCLCLVSGFAYAGTWVENFDDGNYDGWRLVIGSDQHRAQVNVVDGELVFRHFDIGFCEDWLVLEASRSWSNYTLELRLKFTDDVGPGSTRGALITYNDTFDGVPEGGPNTPFLFVKTTESVRNRHIKGNI